MELLKNPVIIGILSALAGAFISWILFSFDKIKIKRETRKLKEHLANQLEITAEGTKSQKKELEKLKKENENLRVSVQSWQQKPDRKEVRMLYVYDKAVSKLIESAPGFGPMWIKALKESEEEFAQTENGLIAFTKNLLGLNAPQKLNAYSTEDITDIVEDKKNSKEETNNTSIE